MRRHYNPVTKENIFSHKKTHIQYSAQLERMHAWAKIGIEIAKIGIEIVKIEIGFAKMTDKISKYDKNTGGIQDWCIWTFLRNKLNKAHALIYLLREFSDGYDLWFIA